MLRSTLLTPTLAAAALLCAACDKPQDQQSQNSGESELQAQEQPGAQPTGTTGKPPSVAETTASEAANEVEQALGPDAQITPKDMAAGISVDDVANPQTALATAAVKTTKGEAIGEVRSVAVGPDGKASAVNVEVGGFLNVGERVVAIKAERFTYLKDRNILVASVSKAEIEKMPVVKEN
jgi:hypothetical protein